ncbi:MAG: glycosyltransferase family 2 protein [Dehalococcoidia bacterium]
MTATASISVVIPVFNNAALVGQAIESVLTQKSAPPTEIIVVDDGSDDSSAEAAARYAGVRVIKRSNGGIGAARNTGIELASGEWLALLDSDDIFPESRQAAMLAAIGEIDAVFGTVVQFRDDGWESGPAPAKLAGTMLIRRTAFDRVGPFDESVHVGEFIDWWSRAEEAAVTSTSIGDTVLRRRIHASNTGIVHADSRVDYTRVLRAALERRRRR